MYYKVFQVGRLMVSSCFLALFMNCNFHDNIHYMESNVNPNSKVQETDIIQKIEQLNICLEDIENIDPGKINVSGIFSSVVEIKSALDYVKNLQKVNKEEVKNLTNKKKVLQDPKDIIDIEKNIAKLKLEYSSLENNIVLLKLESDKFKLEAKKAKEEKKLKENEEKENKKADKLKEKIDAQKSKAEQENNKLEMLKKQMEGLTLGKKISPEDSKSNKKDE